MKKAMAELLDSTSLEKSSQEIVKRFIHHLKYDQGKDRFTASALDSYIRHQGFAGG